MSTQHIATGIQNLKGNEILAMIQQTKEGTMVAIKPLCSALKLAWPAQFRKVTTDPRFSYCDMAMTGPDGKQYQMICLPAEQVPDWINSINARKVTEEKAHALVELQKFFQYALNEFVRGRYITEEVFLKAMAEKDSQIAQLTASFEKAMEQISRLYAANGYRATAAAYSLNARKLELKH